MNDNLYEIVKSAQEAINRLEKSLSPKVDPSIKTLHSFRNDNLGYKVVEIGDLRLPIPLNFKWVVWTKGGSIYAWCDRPYISQVSVRHWNGVGLSVSLADGYRIKIPIPGGLSWEDSLHYIGD